MEQREKVEASEARSYKIVCRETGRQQTAASKIEEEGERRLAGEDLIYSVQVDVDFRRRFCSWKPDASETPSRRKSLKFSDVTAARHQFVGILPCVRKMFAC